MTRRKPFEGEQSRIEPGELLACPHCGADLGAVVIHAQPAAVPKAAYSIEETMAALGVGRDKVTALYMSGLLPSVVLDGRRLIRVEALLQFLRDGEAETIAAQREQTRRTG